MAERQLPEVAEIGRILHGFGSIARLYVAVCIELLVFQPFIILTHNIDAFYGREDRIFIIYSRGRLNSRLNVAGRSIRCYNLGEK